VAPSEGFSLFASKYGYGSITNDFVSEVAHSPAVYLIWSIGGLSAANLATRLKSALNSAEPLNDMVVARIVVRMIGG
jgi:hypothetical protein